MQPLWLSSVFVINEQICCLNVFESHELFISTSSVNSLTLFTWILWVCAIRIQLFTVKCAFLFVASCVNLMWVRGSWFLHLQGQAVKEDLILLGLHDPVDIRYYSSNDKALHSRRLASLAALLWELSISHVEIWWVCFMCKKLHVLSNMATGHRTCFWLLNGIMGSVCIRGTAV